MVEADEQAHGHGPLFWMAVAAGAALGVFGALWVVHRRNPVERMNRLLRRCQDRIGNIESSLAELESSLQPPAV